MRSNAKDKKITRLFWGTKPEKESLQAREKSAVHGAAYPLLDFTAECRRFSICFRSHLVLVIAFVVAVIPLLAHSQSSSSGSYWKDPNGNGLNQARFPSAQAVCDARRAFLNWSTPLVFFVNSNNAPDQPDAGTCRYAPYANYMVHRLCSPLLGYLFWKDAGLGPINFTMHGYAATSLSCR